MAGKHSTRAKRAPSVGPRSGSAHMREVEQIRSDFRQVLDRFSDALALLETVEHAMVAAEEMNEDGVGAIGAEICTLERAAKEIRGIYNELDRVTVGIRDAKL